MQLQKREGRLSRCPVALRPECVTFLETSFRGRVLLPNNVLFDHFENNALKAKRCLLQIY